MTTSDCVCPTRSAALRTAREAEWLWAIITRGAGSAWFSGRKARWGGKIDRLEKHGTLRQQVLHLTADAKRVWRSSSPETVGVRPMTGAHTAASPSNLLALLYTCSGLLCLLGAARPLHEHSPTHLLVMLGLVGVLGGLAFRFVGPRVSPAAVTHTGLALLSLLVALLASQAATAVGIISLGPILLCIGLCAAHFCSRSAARLHLITALVSSTAAATIAEPSLPLTPWIINVASAIAVTEAQSRLVHQLRVLAGTDALTGLPNRRAWLEATNRALAAAARRLEPVTVAVIDLDDFKSVNDDQGHHAGDKLLRDLASAWREQLRTVDVLARYGGDEFALLLPCTDARAAELTLQRMIATHTARWSVGIATWRAGETVPELLQRADAALYSRKRERQLRR